MYCFYTYHITAGLFYSNHQHASWSCLNFFFILTLYMKQHSMCERALLFFKTNYCNQFSHPTKKDRTKSLTLNFSKLKLNALFYILLKLIKLAYTVSENKHMVIATNF